MTSTQEEIEVSYDVSNEFFQLWLDARMHYTCAVFENEGDTLEEAQINKSRVLYDFAELSKDKTVLDIGCGWGANLEYLISRGVKEAHGVTLSSAQYEEILKRCIPGVHVWCVDYRDFSPPITYDGLISIEMIDHLCSPAQAARGLAISLYREYFKKCASWIKPGGCFGFQAILRNRIPRDRNDLADLKFTADIIFPGGLNPRLEELVAAVNPYWEILELKTRRLDYGKTTGEWLRRLRLHKNEICERWGAQVFNDYERYLSTCVRAFAQFWSSDVQMKLRRIPI
ncbi:class I SAM-dependent methyltransferase [Pajaroellobacter abortibovis]|uniref:Cyclopropane-fatty-acyl-phospholipid synthase n=1 Tax=Pajaroellobacter abortibovis TaxID=1882918 RepID=A0A1L6MVW6_9BACT|nr:class I SAM-dependent methyltransferase [Pajaroellobacter abortibovis]APR99555.1 cyclopropane-fatty-acyl-phospholipid synthase [Pajaroellobacter abortibovis]